MRNCYSILDSSILKEFTDDNFKFDENGRKYSKWVENTGKRGNSSTQAISPFPTLFSKELYGRHVKTRACLGKGQSLICCQAETLTDSNIAVITDIF